MLCVNVVEDLPGKGEQVIDVVDVPPPTLELLLGLQFPSLHVNQRVVHTRLEVKLLGKGGSNGSSKHFPIRVNRRYLVVIICNFAMTLPWLYNSKIKASSLKQ